MTLRELITGLRRSAVTILVFVILGVVAAGTYVATAQKQYTAKTRLLVLAVDDTATLTQNYSGNQLVRGSIQSYADLVTSPTVLDPLVPTLGISERSLASKVTADVPLNTLFIDISVEDTSAARASQIASAVAQQAITSIETLQSSTSNGQNSPIQLTDVEPATPPSSASSPKPVLDLVIGLIVGLGIGLAVAGGRGLFIAVPAPIYGVPPTPAPRADEPEVHASRPARVELLDVPAAPEAPAAEVPVIETVETGIDDIPPSATPEPEPEPTVEPEPEAEPEALSEPTPTEPEPAPTAESTDGLATDRNSWSDRTWAAPYTRRDEPYDQLADVEPTYTEPTYTEPTSPEPSDSEPSDSEHTDSEPTYTGPAYRDPAYPDPEAAGVVWSRPQTDPVVDEHVGAPDDSAADLDEDTPPWGAVPANPESFPGDTLRP
jgi:capsular polysaccharide biosynthesis protein